IPMISSTYLGSAAIAVLLALLFVGHVLSSPWYFEALVVGTFFLASAGASAAYLTVSEIFPMETRALAIAFFYATGTAVGGISGPLLFGRLIATDDRTLIMVAFLIGAGVMTLGGIAELFLGVKAEGEKLEDIAKPLTAADAEADADADQPTAREQQEVKEDPAQRRWREREERSRARERSGRRRYRPGPGSGQTFYSPGMIGTAGQSRRPSQTRLDREIDEIAGVLEENGALRRDELAQRVGARRWGPGRFGNALAEAQHEGRIRRLSRTTYGPPRDDS
ncbi:MAG TPA: MFS transporter, partial [Gaiellaceae bacterium]|nr:MFS transporter [Gaiellaceae bacterium]